MGKLKTHRGTKKRVKVTATGKIKVKGVGGRHILTKQKKKNKRKKNQLSVLNSTQQKMVHRLVPNL
jgi:large subunit ribosomal protein L35